MIKNLLLLACLALAGCASDGVQDAEDAGFRRYNPATGQYDLPKK